MLPLFPLPPLREGIRRQTHLRGIKQIASASININGPCETWKFPRCSFSGEWMESEKQLKGGVMRYINQMLAELRRLYSNLCCLKLSVKPSAGDQHAESTRDGNLLTPQQLTHKPCKHTFWHFHPRTVTNVTSSSSAHYFASKSASLKKPCLMCLIRSCVCFCSYIWK